MNFLCRNKKLEISGVICLELSPPQPPRPPPPPTHTHQKPPPKKTKCNPTTTTKQNETYPSEFQLFHNLIQSFFILFWYQFLREISLRGRVFVTLRHSLTCLVVTEILLRRPNTQQRETEARAIRILLITSASQPLSVLEQTKTTTTTTTTKKQNKTKQKSTWEAQGRKHGRDTMRTSLGMLFLIGEASEGLVSAVRMNDTQRSIKELPFSPFL